MIQGSTTTLIGKFAEPLAAEVLADITSVLVRVKNGCNVIDKATEEVSLDTDQFTVTLSAEESAKLCPAYPVEIAIRLAMANGAIAQSYRQLVRVAPSLFHRGCHEGTGTADNMCMGCADEALDFDLEEMTYVGGVADYEQLTNKPSINGVPLIRNKTEVDLGIEALSNIELNTILS